MSLIENKAKLFLRDNPDITEDNVEDDLEVSRRRGVEVEKYSSHELGEMIFEAGDLPEIHWGESGSEVLYAIAEFLLKREMKRLLKGSRP